MFTLGTFGEKFNLDPKNKRVTFFADGTTGRVSQVQLLQKLQFEGRHTGWVNVRCGFNDADESGFVHNW